MDRAPITVFNATTKACADCAHVIPDGLDSRCSRTPKVDPITGADSFYFCSTERVSGECGRDALRFYPSEQAETAKSARKIQLSRAIEEAITHLAPDLNQALEIFDALTASIGRRFEGEIDDVAEAAKEFREVLDEAGNTVPQ